MEENNVSLANVSFLCELCEQQFSTNEELMFHFQVHNVTKPFHCADCGQRYAYKGALVRHK